MDNSSNWQEKRRIKTHGHGYEKSLEQRDRIATDNNKECTISKLRNKPRNSQCRLWGQGNKTVNGII